MIEFFEPKLPQRDARKAHRERQLAESREVYRYSYNWPPGVATAAEVPKADDYSLEYIAHLLPSSWELFSNTLKMAKYVIHEEGLKAFFDREKSRIDGLSPGAIGGWYLNLSAELAQHVTSMEVPAIDVYNDLHQTIPAPEAQRCWNDDQTFVWQRIAGVNPMTLRRVDALPPGILISEAQAAASGNLSTSLAQAIHEGRVFACDFTSLHGVKAGVTFGRNKWLPAPYAIFAASDRGLLPIAIQLAPGQGARVCLPKDGSAWTAARLAVQVADANVHETVEHLGRTHMVMEAVTLAMKRQLAEEHPLRKLLEAHTGCTLAINHSAATNLIAPNGVVDQAFGGAIESSASLVKAALDSFDLRASIPPRALAARGVDDPSIITEFPYRDDALLVYPAIERFARAYVRLYYQQDTDVAGDYELQGFLREFSAQDGGRIRGVGVVDSVEALGELMSVILWTGTAQHAAVNFPQYPYMGAVPNMAGAFWSQWPPENPDAEDLLLKLLPPYNLAMAQVYTVLQLSSLRLNRLGHYSPTHFLHPPARELVETFQRELDAIEATINERDAGRLLSYPFLKPSQIPQSIHI